MEYLLETQQLGKSYAGIHANHDINLQIMPGETHAIIGPNGAGKTTLVNLLSGALPPSSGDIYFCDKKVTGKKLRHRKRLGISRSYQINNLFPDLTVFANVLLAVQAERQSHYQFWRVAGQVHDNRVNELLMTMNLFEKKDSLVASLSYGEQRILEIILSIATRPKLLLLDEPMAGISQENSLWLTSALENLKAEYTILLVEHDMDVVFGLADRITVMVEGQILATGDKESIKNNKQVQEAYLGSDQLQFIS